MNASEPSEPLDFTDDDIHMQAPGPADHGGHGGMATRENSPDDEDENDPENETDATGES